MVVLRGSLAREFKALDGQLVRIGLGAGSQIRCHSLPQIAFGFRIELGDQTVGPHHTIDSFLH